MASESSQSPSPSPSPSPSLGDTFVGSFISLISNSEIRYEGILYRLDVHDSTLALKNVRSYGTEGRKKDGPQIPPSDSVYEFILFRGSDIKDLQVNPAPSTQSTRQELQSEQVINQSSYSKPAIGSPPSGYDNGYGLGRGAQWGHTPALNNKPFPTTQQLPVPPLGFQPPSTNVGSLIDSPVNVIGSTPSNAGLSSMPLPSFMQGNKLASTGMMQQSVSSHSALHNDQKTVESFDSPILGVVDDISHVVTRPTDLPTNPSYANHSSLGQAQLHTPPGLASSPSNFSSVSEPQLSPPYNQNSYPTAPQAVGKNFYDPRSTNPNRMYDLPVVSSDSAPVYPGPPKSFFDMDPVMQSRQPMVNRGPEMFAATNPLSVAGPPRNHGPANYAPLLPLPISSHQSQFPSSGVEFTEEFDFEAMNEKFNKSEVWGLLGKSSQRNQNDQREETIVEPNAESKPAYNKDDFFDTVSCNQLDQVARSRQHQQHTQFPHHMRQVPEAFGNHFQRPPPPQPGQGAYLAAQTNYTNYRGGYNHNNNNNNNYSNQGYGYYNGGRGRGRNTHF